MFPERDYLNFIVSTILGKPIAWEPIVEGDFFQELLRLANYHGVESLLINAMLADDRRQFLSEGIREQLQSILKLSAVIQLARSQDLISVAKAVEREGSRLVLLKGGGLASSHYPLPYLRDRCDTDVFIDLGHIRKIRDVFFKLGYQGQGSIYKSHQFGFISPRFSGMSIHYDVHWRISNSPRFSRIISFEEANQSALPIEGLPGVWGLKPVHALLLACLHRAGNLNHDPNRLIWIYDIHLLAQAFSEEDWLEFCDASVNRGVHEVCLQGLNRSVDVFNTVVPGAVISELSVPPPHDSPIQKVRMSQLGLILDDLHELPDLSSRVEMMGEYLFPSGKYLLSRYGKSSPLWLPVLYCRYVVGSLIARLKLH